METTGGGGGRLRVGRAGRLGGGAVRGSRVCGLLDPELFQAILPYLKITVQVLLTGAGRLPHLRTDSPEAGAGDDNNNNNNG